MTLKRHGQLWDRLDLDTSFSHFEKSSPQHEIKVHLEIHSYFRRVLLDFQSFTEKPVLECPLARPMILFFTYRIKNSNYMNRVSDMQISYGMVPNAHVRQLCPFK